MMVIETRWGGEVFAPNSSRTRNLKSMVDGRWLLMVKGGRKNRGEQFCSPARAGGRKLLCKLNCCLHTVKMTRLALCI